MKITDGKPAHEGYNRCRNDKCRKPLTRKRADAKFCSPACRAAVKSGEKEEGAPVWISQACLHPKQQQAEIIISDRTHRHPVTGSRPQWSGYCVLPDKCGCTKEGCHGPGKFAEIREVGA